MRNRTGTKKKGRTFVSLPVSLSPDDIQWLTGRLQELKPIVANRSHYFKMVLDADKRGELSIFPKDEAQLELAGLAA